MTLSLLSRSHVYVRAVAISVIAALVPTFCGAPAWGQDEMPAAVESAPEDEPLEETITMSFDGASLKDVLLLFSQKSGMNFVASQEVEQRKITVYFEEVSPKEALDAIMATNNLTYSRKPGSSIYMVSSAQSTPAPLITRVFRLKYARLSTSPLDVGGKVTVDELKSVAGSTSSSSSDSSSSEGGSSMSNAENVSSSRGIDSIVRSFLTARGRMATDVATNSLIITDTQEAVDQIQKMLVELDLPQQQVILEVHVMEVQKGLVSDQGIEWGGSNGALLDYSGGVRTTSFPLLEKVFTGEGPNKPLIVEGSDSDDVRTSGSSIGPQMVFGTLSANNFAATLRMIVSDAKTKILARPRILTQNNEAAIIRLVTNTSIANQTETTTANGSTSSSTNEAERSETGVTLRMTPQINSDSSVTLFLEPSVTTVGVSVFFPNTFLDPTTRVVRTIARVQDNETLVIGGLIDSTQSYTKKKIPFLGDVPALGRLFSYDAVDNQDRELVVFVTPHIVKGTNSLTQPHVSTQGRDVLLKKLLNEFSDQAADMHLSAFEPSQEDLDVIGKAKTRGERNEAEQALKRASDPSVERQMSVALDAFSPQMLDDEIAKALSFQSSQSSRSSG